MKRRIRNEAGFTMVELAVVMIIIGVLTAITIPNYLKFAKRAKEASVKENMHVVQSGIEVFAVDNDGFYPQPADEPTLQALMPQASFPANPFTKMVTAIVWNADPGNPGDISIHNLPGGGYMIKGHGSDAVMAPPIVVGN